MLQSEYKSQNSRHHDPRSNGIFHVVRFKSILSVKAWFSIRQPSLRTLLAFFFIYLALLFSEKTQGITVALASSFSCKNWHFAISLLLLKIFTWNAEYVFIIQGAIHIIKGDKQFLLFSLCFLPYMVLIFHFKCTLNCHLQFVSIWASLKFYHLEKKAIENWEKAKMLKCWKPAFSPFPTMFSTHPWKNFSC